MSKKRIQLTLVFLLITTVSIGVYYAYNEYTREPEKAHERKADFNASADAFLDKFESFEDENEALAFFDGKIIELEGEVDEVIPNGDSYDILIGTNDPMIQLNFNLLQKYADRAEGISPGEKVVIRGYLTGKLMDIEFNRAIIME